MSLRARILLIAVVLLAPIPALIVWSNMHLVLDEARANLDQAHVQRFGLLKVIAVEGLLKGDPDWLQEQLNGFESSDDIVEISISDAQSHTLAWLVRTRQSQNQDPIRLQEQTVWSTVALKQGDRELGTLDVRQLKDSMQQTERRARIQALVLGGLGLIFTLILGWLGGGFITRRLAIMTVAAERLARGDFGVQVELRGNDETARLGRAFGRMVNELSRSRAEARGNEKRFELAVQGSADAIWDWDLASDKMYLSPRFEEMLGYSEGQLSHLFTAWLRQVHEEDRDRVRETLQHHIDNGGLFFCEFRMRTAKDDWRWILGRGKVSDDGKGRAVRMVGSFSDVTERKLVNLNLESALNRFQVLIQALPDLFVYLDGKGCWQVVNRVGRELLDLGENCDWQGRQGKELADINPTVRSYLRTGQSNERAAWNSRKPVESIEIIQDPRGRPATLEVTRVPMHDESGEPQGMIVIGRDITERRRAQEALFQEKERAQVTLQSIADGVITTDVKGNITYLNPPAERLLDARLGEVAGESLAPICHIYSEEGREPIEDPVLEAFKTGKVVELPDTNLLVNRSRGEFFVNVSAAPMRNRQAKLIGCVMVMHDMTEQRELMRQLTFQASHDALTGLANRREFERRLRIALEEDDERQHVLCYMDLDRFKVVNDSSGHAAGDELLRRVAGLICESVRKHDSVARLGGDEFGVLLLDCPLEQALIVAGKVREAVVSYRFTWEGQTFAVGVSIGIVPIPKHSGDLGNLMIEADEACYTAKEKSHSRIHVGHGDDGAADRRRGEIRWVTRLRQAFDDESFVLFAQPIVPVEESQRQYRHYEILLRMKDEAGKIIGPGGFMPAAERYGLIANIDRWVVENAIEALAAAYDTEHGMMINTFSINLSGASMDDEGFLGFIKELLQHTKLPSNIICFEITETVAIANFGSAMRFINELKGLGCRFSLDDFGSGFSSFSYLKTLPVDYLKIDGSFVRNMSVNANDFAMVDAINKLGKVMNLKTIAEFVGDQETLDGLKRLGVDYAQGFYLGRPEPLYEALYGGEGP